MSALPTTPPHPHRPPFTVGPETAPAAGTSRRASAEELAALTRAAYTDSDPLPRLPVPDGCRETPEQAAADLAGGQLLWMARDAHHAPIAALRVLPRATRWEIRRVAVAPAWRGRSLARALLAAVEQAAVAQGVRVLELDAVVERCLPALYTRLGFTPVRVFRADDKPLTEWHMEHRLDNTATEAAPATPGLFLCWFTAGGHLLAAVRHADDPQTALARIAPALPPATALAGIDNLPGATAGTADRLLRHLPPGGAELAPGVFSTARPRTGVDFHLLPRAFEPRLMSLTRTVPGRELPLAAAGPTKNE